MPENLNLQKSIARALQYYLGDYYFYTGLRRRLEIGMIGSVSKRVFSEEEHINDIEGLHINIEPVRSTSKVHEPYNFISYSADTNKAAKIKLDDNLNAHIGSKNDLELILYYSNPKLITFNFNQYATKIADSLPERLSSRFYDFVIADTLLNVDSLVVIHRENLDISNDGTIDLSKIIQSANLSGEMKFKESISGIASIYAEDVTLAVDLIRFASDSFGAKEPFFEKI